MSHGTDTHGRGRTGRGGFTLAELMVVISVITLILAMAIPTLTAVFGAGAEEQAVNVVAAYLMAARSVAVRDATYAGMHVQMGDAAHGIGGQCYLSVVSVVSRQATAPKVQFGAVAGYAPVRLPGGMALGEISGRSVSGADYRQSGVTGEDDFTTFTVVFSPSGKVVTQVEGQDIYFRTSDVLFSSDPNLGVWKAGVANADTNSAYGTGEPGAAAMTLFEYGKYKARDDAGKQAYLQERGQFLPVNVHTGQLFPRR